MNSLRLQLALSLALFGTQVPFALAGDDPWPYWDIRQFEQLTALTPELQHPRLLSIPNASSQALWEKGQMRVHQGPWDTLLGDFTGDGQQAIAVILAVGGSDQDGNGAAKYLVIATLNKQGGERLLLERLDNLLQRLDEHKAYASDKEHRLYNGELVKHTTTGLIFDPKRHIVGVATVEKQRLTKAASISTTPRVLPNGQVEVVPHRQDGYVLDKRLILPFRWRAGVFHREEPCWFLDSEAEDALRDNGVDPESERVLRRTGER